ncbi:MAG: VanZ family protein [Streptococcaceae bacterium]|jgi:glycopeptide antibiotics resistance protein|nr:VanZ family protein [Streptococcaceae bacterium]
MKKLSKFLFGLYFVFLIWLLFFKLDISQTLIVIQQSGSGERHLNLIPFAASGGLSEILFNVVVFIPFGILAKISRKRLAEAFIWVVALSLCIETAQYITNAGSADITDLITNSIGGFIGIGLAASRKWDKFWLVLLSIFAILFAGAYFYALISTGHFIRF